MLESVKTALRISNSAYDTEVQDLIESAKLDLKITGVNKLDETDALIRRAIITYAKANFGIDTPQAERFQQSYEMLKQHLSLAGDYHELG